MRYPIFKSLVTLASLLLASNFSQAQSTLFIDFGPGAIQPGFTAQTTASVDYTTDAGTVTITSDGSFFNRSSGNSFTDAALLGDFTFKNSFGTLSLTISGAGVSASTGYDIKFYSQDSHHGGTGGTVTYTGVSGTTGNTSIVYSSADIGADGYSATATFTSDGSGTISIDVTGTNEGPRISGMEFTVVPEASAALLMGSLTALFGLRRRR